MKLIDGKGKIFGKINLFDFLVILFLVGLIPVFYLGNKALLKRTDVKDFKMIPIQVKFTSIIPELANALHEGDVIKNSDGEAIGVLKRVISNAPSEAISINQLNIRTNDYLLVPNPSAKDVVCLFKLNCTEEKGCLFFNGYTVKIGSNLILSSDNYDIQGITIHIDRGDSAVKKGR